jgi:hypothetical protein
MAEYCQSTSRYHCHYRHYFSYKPADPGINPLGCDDWLRNQKKDSSGAEEETQSSSFS